MLIFPICSFLLGWRPRICCPSSNKSTPDLCLIIFYQSFWVLVLACPLLIVILKGFIYLFPISEDCKQSDFYLLLLLILYLVERQILFLIFSSNVDGRLMKLLWFSKIVLKVVKTQFLSAIFSWNLNKKYWN